MTTPPHSLCHGVPDTERYKEKEEEEGGGVCQCELV